MSQPEITSYPFNSYVNFILIFMLITKKGRDERYEWTNKIIIQYPNSFVDNNTGWNLYFIVCWEKSMLRLTVAFFKTSELQVPGQLT